MSGGAPLAGRWRGRLASAFDADKRHHGLQLVAAVLLAYAASALLGLPEHLWAVMTTLIVMRPNAGGTWEAGWDRARGTLVGALAGLAGVYLDHHGGHPLATLLGVVATLSFVSAASPGLRSAPMAALIILGAGDLPGHPALQVAVLRMGQILLGVAVAMAVALVSSRYRAPARFHQGCAALLGRLAAQLPRAADGAAADDAEAEKSGAAVKRAIERLTALAASADREMRMLRPWRRNGGSGLHRRLAGLTARLVQDSAVLGRVLRIAAQPAAQAATQPTAQPTTDPAATWAAEVAAAALAGVARHLAGGEPADLGALSRLVAAAGRRREGDAADSSADRIAMLLGGPLHLLLGDMRRISALLSGASSAKERRSPAGAKPGAPAGSGSR